MPTRANLLPFKGIKLTPLMEILEKIQTDSTGKRRGNNAYKVCNRSRSKDCFSRFQLLRNDKMPKIPYGQFIVYSLTYKSSGINFLLFHPNKIIFIKLCFIESISAFLKFTKSLRSLSIKKTVSSNVIIRIVLFFPYG